MMSNSTNQPTPETRLLIYKTLLFYYNHFKCNSVICNLLQVSIHFKKYNLDQLPELLQFRKNEDEEDFLWDSDYERVVALEKAIELIYTNHPQLANPNQFKMII